MRKGGHGQTSSSSISRHPSATRLPGTKKSRPQSGVRTHLRPVSGKKRDQLPKVPWEDNTSSNYSALSRKLARLANQKAKVLREAELPRLPDLVPKEASGLSAWVPAPPRALPQAKEAVLPGKILPGMTEIADRIANRYAGGLNRLNQEQLSWRQKHDAYQRRRMSPSSSASDFSQQAPEVRRPVVVHGPHRSTLSRGPAAPSNRWQPAQRRTFARKIITHPESEESDEAPEIEEPQEEVIVDYAISATIRDSFSQFKSQSSLESLDKKPGSSGRGAEDDEEEAEEQEDEEEGDGMGKRLEAEVPAGDQATAQHEKNFLGSGNSVSSDRGCFTAQYMLRRPVNVPMQNPTAAGNAASSGEVQLLEECEDSAKAPPAQEPASESAVIPAEAAVDSRIPPEDEIHRPVREAERDEDEHDVHMLPDPQMEHARALARDALLRIFKRLMLPASGADDLDKQGTKTLTLRMFQTLTKAPNVPDSDSDWPDPKVLELERRMQPKPFVRQKRYSMFAPTAAARQTMTFEKPSKRFSVFDAGEFTEQGQEKRSMPKFEECVSLAKKNRMSLANVRSMLEEFSRLDTSGTGLLSVDEFKQAIKERCNIPAHQPLPVHLLDVNFQEADTDDDGMVNFEEFLLWSTNHAFIEEFVVSDPKERYLRSVARKHGFVIDLVEKIHGTFVRADVDRNASIDESEFRNVMAQLWNCDLSDIPPKRLRQFWLEADVKRMGKLNFEDFLVWYTSFGIRST